MRDGSGVGEIFRDQWPRLVAVLLRDFGDLDLAEESAQDAFLEAAARWNTDGRPRSPEAWLITTARRKAIDRLRRETRLVDRMASVASSLSRLPDCEPGRQDPELVDEQLVLLLGCCHPALSDDAQVALTLRIVGGLSTEQIARAFLTSGSTMGRRLTRARTKIRSARIPFSTLDQSTLVTRLAAVRRVIYLIFSEGHTSTASTPLVRGDLCDEAVWLAELLAKLVPDEPEVRGLAALVLLIDARRASRVVDGAEVLLTDQDRSLWDRELIDRGLAHLGAAHAQRSLGPFQLQAAIASLHVTAPSFGETDWPAIVRLYDALLRREPSTIVALNRAVAVSYADGPLVGLDLVEALADDRGIGNYPYYHSTRAELLAQLGRTVEAATDFETAMSFCTNEAQMKHLRRRLRCLTTGSADNNSPRTET